MRAAAALALAAPLVWGAPAPAPPRPPALAILAVVAVPGPGPAVAQAAGRPAARGTITRASPTRDVIRLPGGTLTVTHPPATLRRAGPGCAAGLAVTGRWHVIRATGRWARFRTAAGGFTLQGSALLHHDRHGCEPARPQLERALLAARTR